jgi:glycosyltransferase involved in cell wall biosynthesis
MPATLGLVWALKKQVLFFHATTTFMLERRMHGRGRIPTALHNLVIKLSTKHADVLAVTTETTARELFSHFGFVRQYHVIGDGIKDFADSCGLAAGEIVCSLAGRRFLLFTSSFYELKNQKLLIDLFNQGVDGKLLLVLVGSGIQRDYFNQCQAAKGDNVRIFEDVDDATLRWLYAHAALYISPSLFEGFSMTPFESLLCDCPILLSDIPVHREVYGEGFRYFNPRDTGGLKAMIAESLSKEYREECLALRNGLIEKYSWPGFLEKNLELYREALGTRGSN